MYIILLKITYIILGDYMIIDYGRKMEVVLDFYEQAQEILSMVHDDIKGLRSYNDFEPGGFVDLQKLAGEQA